MLILSLLVFGTGTVGTKTREHLETPWNPRNVCPASLCPTTAFPGSNASGYSYFTVPSSTQYLAIYMWGAGGPSGQLGRAGGYGAFIAGALRVESGEALRLIVGATQGETDFEGCGGPMPLTDDNFMPTIWAGGRSAVQRRAPGGEWVELATAGGGGEGNYYSGGHAGQGLEGHGSESTPGGKSRNYNGSCQVGARGCGGAAVDGFHGGGGGGYCGGLGGDGGGGGSSNPSQLLCASTADYFAGNFSDTPYGAGGGAGTPFIDGAIFIAVLPPSWKPCTDPSSSF